MNDQSYRTTLVVDATPDQAFEAINDVRGWWSQDVDGRTDTVGAEFAYRGNQDGVNVHRARIRVTELVPGQRVVWHVLDNWMSFIDDQAEWKDTRIVFEISPTDGGHGDPLQPPRPGAGVRVLRRLLRRLDVLRPVQPAGADRHRARRAHAEAGLHPARRVRLTVRDEEPCRPAPSSRATPAGAWACRRRSASLTSARSPSPGGTRAGLSATPSAQALMSGSAPNDAAARVPRTFIVAQSARVLPYGEGGHSRFFSASSSRVASTYPTSGRPEAREPGPDRLQRDGRAAPHRHQRRVLQAGRGAVHDDGVVRQRDRALVEGQAARLHASDVPQPYDALDRCAAGRAPRWRAWAPSPSSASPTGRCGP